MAQYGYCRRIRNISPRRHIRLLVRICPCHSSRIRPLTQCSPQKNRARHPHPFLLWQSRPMDLWLPPKLLWTHHSQKRRFHRHRRQTLLSRPRTWSWRKTSLNSHSESHIRKLNNPMAFPPFNDTPPWLRLWLSLECAQSQKTRFHYKHQPPPQLLRGSHHRFQCLPSRMGKTIHHTTSRHPLYRHGPPTPRNQYAIIHRLPTPNSR